VLLVLSLLYGANAGADIGVCIRPQSALVDTAPSPSGEAWRVLAGVRNNGGRCDQWLFQVMFRLPKVISWASGTSIPVSGHTSRTFSISALDAESPDNEERVFSGYTGREVAKIVASFESGVRAVIKPSFPPAPLRKKFVWMRSFRYFVFYHAFDVGVVESVSLFTKEGHLLYRGRSESGAF
jgi:hypothetical protein